MFWCIICDCNLGVFPLLIGIFDSLYLTIWQPPASAGGGPHTDRLLLQHLEGADQLLVVLGQVISVATQAVLPWIPQPAANTHACHTVTNHATNKICAIAKPNHKIEGLSANTPSAHHTVCSLWKRGLIHKTILLLKASLSVQDSMAGIRPRTMRWAVIQHFHNMIQGEKNSK